MKHPLSHLLVHHGIFIGKGIFQGNLYDLGRYPGAVKDGKGAEVIGDLFLLSDPEQVLKLLDKYEGLSGPEDKTAEFVRQKTSVQMRSGGQKKAWIYWYNFDPKDKKKIRYKNYLNYLKNKSTT